MIVSFGDRPTEDLFHGRSSPAVRRIPEDIQVTALRKLDVLHGAEKLQDVRNRPGNRLEALKGNLKGFHSIRINDQWRILFRWKTNQAHEVKVADYH